MSDIDTKPRTKIQPKTQRPRLHKVILVNDDFTPREFVVIVLKAEFRIAANDLRRSGHQQDRGPDLALECDQAESGDGRNPLQRAAHAWTPALADGAYASTLSRLYC